MDQAFIVDYLRSPIGSFGGGLSTLRTDDLAALAIKKLMEKNPELPSDKIEDVIIGCTNQAGEDNRNVARMALLLAGLPYTVPGETVNRLCASGMAATINAARSIQCGDADFIVAGGVENMTRGPWVISKTSRAFGTDAQMYDSSFGWRFVNPRMKEMYGTDSMGVTAENLAAKYRIHREEQDMFACWSQEKATAAASSGRLEKEIFAIELTDSKQNVTVFSRDEFIKPATSLEGLARLKPAFKPEGTVTAGNSSGLNDGAATLLIASSNAIVQYGLKPMARIAGSAVVGVEPRIMGIGPVPATIRVLEKTKLGLDHIDLIEINEAFAVQVLACLRELKLDPRDPRINVNGGAIALGHPLGMTGARILGSAALDLHLLNKKYALVTMCIGVGQGYAVILEKV